MLIMFHPAIPLLVPHATGNKVYTAIVQHCSEQEKISIYVSVNQQQTYIQILHSY